jgi:hypothetical protein
MGRLDVVEYRDWEELRRLVVEAATDMQLVSVSKDLQEKGTGLWGGKVRQFFFGMAQSPALDDFADGVDTLALLTGLEGSKA